MRDPMTARTLQAEPNVTPMIDVLMVLLIIFMVIVPLSRRAVDVQLPVTDAGVTDQTTAIVLDVGPGGALSIDRQPLSVRELGRRLHAIYDARRDKVIFVHGQARASYQEVVSAIDSARGAGVRVIGLDPRR